MYRLEMRLIIVVGLNDNGLAEAGARKMARL